MNGHLGNMILLHSLGAYPFSATNYGETPLSCVKRSKKDETIKWLESIER